MALIWYKMPGLSNGLAFNNETFFLVLLPFIIFESGFSVHRQSLFRNMGSILTFAIIGTFLSVFGIGGFLFVTAKARGYTFSFLDCMIVGSVLSSTDPVATLSIVRPSTFSLLHSQPKTPSQAQKTTKHHNPPTAPRSYVSRPTRPPPNSSAPHPTLFTSYTHHPFPLHSITALAKRTQSTFCAPPHFAAHIPIWNQFTIPDFTFSLITKSKPLYGNIPSRILFHHLITQNRYLESFRHLLSGSGEKR